MSESSLHLVILAGGASSRMKASVQNAQHMRNSDLLTQAAALPKGMIGVGVESRPILDYLLFNAVSEGIRDVVFVCADGDTTIEQRYNFLREHPFFNTVQFTFTPQRIPSGRTTPVGTADAVLQALLARPDWKGGSFIACNSDNVYSRAAFRALLNLGSQGGLIAYDAEALGLPMERVAQFGTLLIDEDDYLRGITEKPGIDKLRKMLDDKEKRVWISMNIWKFQYDTVFSFLRDCPLSESRNEKELPAAVANMVHAHPSALKAVYLSESVPDLTRIDDAPSMREYLAQLDPLPFPSPQ